MPRTYAMALSVGLLLVVCGFASAQTATTRKASEEMSGLKAALPASAWTVEEQPWTPEMFRQAAGLLGERERAEKILQRWEDGHSLTWISKSDPMRQTALGLLRFKDGDGARAYTGLAADLQRKQDERIRGGCGADRCVLDSRCWAVTVNGADEAFCVARQWQPAPKAPTVKVWQMWVRSGNRVLEYSWVSGEGDVPWAERVFQQLERPSANR